LARIIAIAMSPRGGRGRVVADDGSAPAGRGPLRFEGGAAVAAEVARVAPELAIAIKVLRREDVDRQRLDAFGRSAVPGSRHALLRDAIRSAARRAQRSDHLIPFRIAIDAGGRVGLELGGRSLGQDRYRGVERRAAADAHEVELGGLL